jgi:DnaJ-class molecular chaperone
VSSNRTLDDGRPAAVEAADRRTVRCFSCAGRGRVRLYSRFTHPAFVGGKLVRCERCKGTGRREVDR